VALHGTDSRESPAAAASTLRFDWGDGIEVPPIPIFWEVIGVEASDVVTLGGRAVLWGSWWHVVFSKLFISDIGEIVNALFPCFAVILIVGADLL